jgi:hypothetical protein
VNPEHPDLAALLRGELSNAEAFETAAHARRCQTCRTDLVDLALGHGLLSAARRTVGPARVNESPDRDRQLPTDLRRQLARERGRRRWARPLVAAVVAAGVLVAGGVGLDALVRGQDDQARPAVAAEKTATLEPVDDPADRSGRRAGGEVTMATDRQLVTRMSVDTVDLPMAARGEFYYVWLFDPQTQKMLPLGVVTPGRPASFDVPESLVEAYSAVDISLEADDGDPGHSVNSVLRASYAAASSASGDTS